MADIENYAPVICYSLLLKPWPIEIVDLPIDSMVIFHSYVNVYQRVIAGPNRMRIYIAVKIWMVKLR